VQLRAKSARARPPLPGHARANSTRYSTALILNPALNADQLMKAITTEFGLPIQHLGLDRPHALAVFNEFLLRQVEQGRETVLIIDEAQDLSEDMLEQIRLLSKFGNRRPQVLQICFNGPARIARPTEQTRIAAASPAHHRTLSSAPAQSV